MAIFLTVIFKENQKSSLDMKISALLRVIYKKVISVYANKAYEICK